MILAIADSAAWLIWPAVLVVCIALDSQFCGLETGIYVMNKNRLDLHAEAGMPAARFLKRMLQQPDRLLAVLLIGTNLTRYAATFAISAMFVLAGHEARAEWYTLLAATPLLFVLGDSVPKVAYHRLGASAVYRMTWLLRGSRAVFTVIGLCPLVTFFASLLMKLTGSAGRSRPTLGHEGVAAVVAEGHASGVLTHFQSVMVDRVMNITAVTVQQAMVPMRSVVAAPAGTGRQELMDIIRANNYSRLPVTDRTGKVTNILDVYDILAADRLNIAEAKTPPLVLPAELTVTEALYRMRRSRQAMAVVQRDGKHVGIVTIKDLVEEIVGELEAW